jgi:hypothetical protein
VDKRPVAGQCPTCLTKLDDHGSGSGATPALGQWEVAGEGAEQRGLAGAVGSHQANSAIDADCHIDDIRISLPKTQRTFGTSATAATRAGLSLRADVSVRHAYNGRKGHGKCTTRPCTSGMTTLGETDVLGAYEAAGSVTRSACACAIHSRFSARHSSSVRRNFQYPVADSDSAARPRSSTR